MTVLTRTSNNQSVSLGKQIASSGEGEVWETNVSGYLAKIYHNPTLERIEKLKVMVANPPAPIRWWPKSYLDCLAEGFAERPKCLCRLFDASHSAESGTSQHL
jgi:DNA-binding helix-hairpin-helix protein with protein kinase domain